MKILTKQKTSLPIFLENPKHHVFVVVKDHVFSVVPILLMMKSPNIKQ